MGVKRETRWEGRWMEEKGGDVKSIEEGRWEDGTEIGLGSRKKGRRMRERGR